MSNRDELARQIAEKIQPGSYDDAMEIAKLINHHPHDLTSYGVAQAILAAGYRKSPTSEEDIERAAKAVYNLDGRAGAWETRDEEIRELYREDARAVAAALGFPATFLPEPEPNP